MAFRTIKTRLTDEMYEKLTKKRCKAGLPSISALFLDSCGVLTDEDTAQEIVRLAMIRAKKKARGTPFRMRDLFVGAVWDRYAKGARVRAGRMFFDRVSAARDGVRATRKASGGHQLYERG